MSLRRKLNKILEPRGYKIIKKDRFKELLINEYNKCESFFFVQVGANDGVKFDNLYEFVTSRRCSGIVIEPISFYFKKLKDNYQKYPDIKPIRIAIHKDKKKANLYYVDPTKLKLLPEYAEGIGSFDIKHHEKSNISDSCMISEKVECVNLMDLIKKYNISNINLLQIDAEGYDAEIIKMINFDIIRPTIIKYEHANLDAKEQHQLIKILESNKYVIFESGLDSIAFCKNKCI